jgi:hypothetical protein
MAMSASESQARTVARVSQPARLNVQQPSALPAAKEPNELSGAAWRPSPSAVIELMLQHAPNPFHLSIDQSGDVFHGSSSTG